MIKLQIYSNSRHQQLFPNDPYSNFTLTYQSQTFKLQKAFLVVESGYFQKLFKEQPTLEQLDITSILTQYKKVDRETFSKILSCFYGFDQAFPHDAVIDIFTAVNFLQVDSLLASLLESVRSSPSSYHPIELFEIATVSHCEGLLDTCRQMLCSRGNVVVDEKFKEKVSQMTQSSFMEFLRYVIESELMDDKQAMALIDLYQQSTQSQVAQQVIDSGRHFDKFLAELTTQKATRSLRPILQQCRLQCLVSIANISKQIDDFKENLILKQLTTSTQISKLEFSISDLRLTYSKLFPGNLQENERTYPPSQQPQPEEQLKGEVFPNAQPPNNICQKEKPEGPESITAPKQQALLDNPVLANISTIKPQQDYYDDIDFDFEIGEGKGQEEQRQGEDVQREPVSVQDRPSEDAELCKNSKKADVYRLSQPSSQVREVTGLDGDIQKKNGSATQCTTVPRQVMANPHLQHSDMQEEFERQSDVLELTLTRSNVSAPQESISRDIGLVAVEVDSKKDVSQQPRPDPQGPEGLLDINDPDLLYFEQTVDKSLIGFTPEKVQWLNQFTKSQFLKPQKSCSVVYDVLPSFGRDSFFDELVDPNILLIYPKLTQIYKGTLCGFSKGQFLHCCAESAKKKVVIIITDAEKNIFGGYIHAITAGTGGGWVTDAKALIFSITKRRSFPVKNADRAYSFRNGEWIRFGDDIVISDECELWNTSVSHFPTDYLLASQRGAKGDDKSEENHFPKSFKVTEIEFYQISYENQVLQK